MTVPLSSILVFIAVAFAPLNPFAPGPSAQAVPLLAGGACIAILVAAFRRSSMKAAVWAWIFASVASSIAALLQYFDLAQAFTPWINAADVGEAYANLRQRNQFATLTNIGLAALLWTLADYWQRTQKVLSAAQVAGVVFAVGLLVAGNAASSSRTGFVQLVLVVSFVAAWPFAHRRRLLVIALGAALAYVFAAVVLPSALETFAQASGRSVFARLAQVEGCESRLILWANVLDLIREKPWTGWGWGELDYAHYATLYRGERFCAILDNAHNLPLHVAVEFGIPVALVAFGGLGWLLVRAAPWRAQQPIHRLAWTVLAIIAIHSMVEYPLWYAPFHTAAGLCVVFLLMPATAEFKLEPPRWLALARAGLALVLAGALSMIWHDYQEVSQLYLPPELRDTQVRQQTAAELSKRMLFRNQAEFAVLTTTALTAANATEMAGLAQRLLHYSPESRVIEVLVESLTLAGRQDEAVWHLARYRAAFPADYQAWRHRNLLQAPPSL